MTDSFPIRDQLRGVHTRDAIDQFLGYEEISDNSRVQTYHDGNIVTLDGANGPWFARQLMGEYSGVLASYWNEDDYEHDAEIIADYYGWDHCSWYTAPIASEISDGNVLGELFTGVDKQPITEEMTIRPIHG